MGSIPVLLVCDHPDTADLYQSALEYGGFRTSVARTPAEAVALMRQEHADAVVVLIGPGDDPVAIGRAFRAEPGSAAATLVALSSVQHAKETLRAALQSFDDAMLIPCTPETLIARISEIAKEKNRETTA